MFKQDKREIFSFRKFKNGRTESTLIGAAILMIGLGMMTTSHSVSASEVSEAQVVAIERPADLTVIANVTQSANVSNEKESTEKEVIVKSKKAVSTNETNISNIDTEQETNSDAVQLNKSQLESYVNEVSANLANGKYEIKTDESIALLRTSLNDASSALNSAKTQDELNKAYRSLVTTVSSKLKNKPIDKAVKQKSDATNGKETVGVKAENTEPSSVNHADSKDERNGKSIETGSSFRSATEGYTFETTEKRHENGEFATATGKSYDTLDNNNTYKLYVHGYQSENTERLSATNETPATGGRTDIPLSREEAKKLWKESIYWDGKLRPSGTALNDRVKPKDLDKYIAWLERIGNAPRYGAGGAYEFLTTEIYGYAYEQGKHYVYVPDVMKRFSLSDEAKAVLDIVFQKLQLKT